MWIRDPVFSTNVPMPGSLYAKCGIHFICFKNWYRNGIFYSPIPDIGIIYRF